MCIYTVQYIYIYIYIYSFCYEVMFSFILLLFVLVLFYWFISNGWYSSVYIWHFNITCLISSLLLSLVMRCDIHSLALPCFPPIHRPRLTLNSQHALLKAARLKLCFDWEENSVLPWPFLISSSALPSWLKQIEVITVWQICSIYSTYCCSLSHQPENSLSLSLSLLLSQSDDYTGLTM